MQLAEVIGTVVATRKEESLRGVKLLVLKTVDVNREPVGSYVVAVDAVGAGVGEIVIYASGSSSRMTELTKERPVDAIVMGIVDSLEIAGKFVYQK
ncbi:MAG TPA: EutN/CcmL family microcompartment protein [Candidatus Krumholzibacteria bacterium]|nr:EutN/CcmL family microcompartment protein [Candidatus Krumholzibacteria bacterium]